MKCVIQLLCHLIYFLLKINSHVELIPHKIIQKQFSIKTKRGTILSLQRQKSLLMQKANQKKEVAPSCLFLVCDDSSYITGQVLHLNGREIVNG
jgi:NAD(P)-dependent dehydrogenase (short-subunit alcohol dehydrogenase family)